MTPRHIGSWFAKHRALVIDCTVSLLLMGFWAMLSTPMLNDAGLLFRWDPVPALLWCFLLTAPYAFHRVRPTLSVNLFLGVVIAQIVFGPSLIIADVMALPMLYTALVYGNTDQTHTYLRWAAVLGASTALAAGLSNQLTPLSEWMRVRMGGTAPELSVSCSPDPVNGQWIAAPFQCAASIMGNAFLIGIMFAIAIIMIVVAAFWQRARRQTIQLLAERNRAIEARQEEEKRIAASAERARIARDMHDVVAHTLSIIIVQADGGRYATVNNPTMACETMETIRHESELALRDMKNLLSVFGGSVHGGYADIPLLIRQATQASDTMTITHTVKGSPDAQLLNEQAGIVLYHVVQESLTNVRKYAGPQVHVDIREIWDAHTVTMIIHDDGRGAAASLDGHQPGFGLQGMRERVESVNGSVASGPAISGGFTVTATVPASVDATENTADSSNTDTEKSHANASTYSPATAVPTKDRENTNMAVIDSEDAVAPTSQEHHSPIAVAHAWTERVSWLRSKPFEHSQDGSHGNWIMRLSHWTEHHYVLTDTLAVFIVIAFMLSNDIGLFTVVAWDYMEQHSIIITAITVILMLPLCLRRRYPRTVAVTFAVLAALQLVFLPNLYSADFFALLAIYTCALYGRKREWMWMVPTILAVSTLTGVKVGTMACGYRALIVASIQMPKTCSTVTQEAVKIGVQFAVLTAMVCMIALLAGAWARQKGENPQVLQARAEALQAEEAKQRVMAANRERDRISAQIQTEVSETLYSVIDQTNTELDSIHAELNAGAAPTPESIGNAFASIAKRGRAALSRMRMLLKVLRETGFSDEHEDDDNHMIMPLSPISGTHTAADREAETSV